MKVCVILLAVMLSAANFVLTADTSTSSDPVTVSYTVWIRNNVSKRFTRFFTAKRNSTFYSVMQLAAKKDRRFRFEATESVWGHFVTSLNGYSQNPNSSYYWMLYQTPRMPNPRSPPGNNLLTPVGVDGVLIDQGDHYLFWLKQVE